MGFWIFMVSMLSLIPITMIGLGKYFISAVPKKPTMILGYRTAMSMKNQDTWQFAHQYCGKIWLRAGMALLPMSVLGMLFTIGQSYNTIGFASLIPLTIQILVLIGSISPTERALKKNFDRNGNRIC